MLTIAATLDGTGGTAIEGIGIGTIIPFVVNWIVPKVILYSLLEGYYLEHP